MFYFIVAVIVFWTSLIGLAVWRARWMQSKNRFDRDYKIDAIGSAIIAPFVALILALAWIVVVPVAFISWVVYVSPKLINKW